MRPCDVHNRIFFACLVTGLIIGAGGALLGVALLGVANNGKPKNYEARIEALEAQLKDNGERLSFVASVASQAAENSIRAHKRINRVNLEIGSDEQPQ